MRGLSTMHLHVSALIALLFAVAAFAPSSASAAPPPQLSQFCEAGEGAGECRSPGGIATDPSNGDIYVADSANNRINVFSIWGTFLRAWGWGVLDGKSELQTCTAQTGCLKGLKGSGAGQFGQVGQVGGPGGVTIDSAGDVYVVEELNPRVQKFDSEGNFLLMFGGGVNEGGGTPSSPGNLCTAQHIANGDACGAGSFGPADGQFSGAGGVELYLPSNDFIEVGPGDKVYVGDYERIQRFDTGGNYVESIPVPGEQVNTLAVDPINGDLYVSFCRPAGPGRSPCIQTAAHVPGSKPNVHKLSPAGAMLATLAVESPRALATDSAGNLYVADKKTFGKTQLEIRQFTSGGTEVPNFAFNDGFDESIGIATSSACGVSGTDLYVSNFTFLNGFVRAYGTPPNAAICPPPNVPPRITAQYATSVDTTGATLKADISPEFFSDATYYVQYGVGKCSEGGCDQEKPLAPGSKLTSLITNNAITTAGIFLDGLEPATTYHYRFVAQSSGGGPVRGVGGKIGLDGKEGTFITFPLPSAKEDCQNQAFRVSASAKLPDCRAYEMVSPVEKNGGDVLTGPLVQGFIAPRRTAPDGNRFTFTSQAAFANAPSAPLVSQYLSTRGAEGWSTESISVPRGVNSLWPVGFTGPFKAFSEDLCSAWVLQGSNLGLTPDAPPGVAAIYRRQNCGAQGYELLTNVAPEGFGPGKIKVELYTPLPQGFSADEEHTVFRTPAAFTNNACKTPGIYQVYISSKEGPLRLVSMLPGGTATCSHSSAGVYEGTIDTSTESSLFHAISIDGSRVFWTDSGSTATDGFRGAGPGKLYVRLNATQAPAKAGSGCSEPERACTLPIYTAGQAFFWGANAEGTKAIYNVEAKQELFEYDVAKEESTLIAKGAKGVAGISEDASRVYFVSTEALSATPNSQGDTAEAGKRNLYLYESGSGGSYAFIGTLADIDGRITSNKPGLRGSRVTPDGLHISFEASTSLTGYDNASLGSGVPATELYVYDAEEGGPGQLRCVSCNPSGARPAGHLITNNDGSTIFGSSSATLPGWPEHLRPSRLLSEDGSRLFFQSYDALLPSDSNGKQDVYAWQRADGPEACEEAGAQLYSQSAEGCISLISSGQSPEDSEVIDASKSAGDVFFITNSSLLPQDPGLYDVYDARVGGGYPPPPSPAPACEGEACQGVPTAPNDPTPASSSYEGAGNVVEKKTAKKKAKAKKRKHAKKHKAKKRANKTRRAGR